MSLDITELDTVSYPSWWATSTTVRISAGGNVQYEGATADVEFLPQGVSYPYAVIPWSEVNKIQGLS